MWLNQDPLQKKTQGYGKFVIGYCSRQNMQLSLQLIRPQIEAKNHRKVTVYVLINVA